MELFLTGLLPGVLLVSAVLTAVVSVVLLWLYRRSMLRHMGRAVDAPDSPTALRKAAGRSAAPGIASPPLAMETWRPDTVPPPPAQIDSAYRRVERSLWTTAAIYGVGGLVYAVMMTFPWMASVEGGFVLSRFMMLLAYHLWPIVLVVAMVAVSSLRGRLATVSVYLAFLFAASLYALSQSTQLTMGQILFLWLLLDAPATLLLLAFLRRRVRAVGPCRARRTWTSAWPTSTSGPIRTVDTG